MYTYYSNRVVFFFFKPKTAYDMRISDWSSDVCSSDLWSKTLFSRRGVSRPISKVVPVTATAHSRSVEFPGVRIDVPRVSWVQGIADPERPRPRVRWVEPGAPPFRQSFVFFKRSEEHTSEVQSLMRISYAVFCLHKKTNT